MYKASKWLVLLQDVKGDGIVNIVDIFLVALAFGSKPGDTTVARKFQKSF